MLKVRNTKIAKQKARIVFATASAASDVDPIIPTIAVSTRRYVGSVSRVANAGAAMRRMALSIDETSGAGGRLVCMCPDDMDRR